MLVCARRLAQRNFFEQLEVVKIYLIKLALALLLIIIRPFLMSHDTVRKWPDSCSAYLNFSQIYSSEFFGVRTVFCHFLYVYSG